MLPTPPMPTGRSSNKPASSQSKNRWSLSRSARPMLCALEVQAIARDPVNRDQGIAPKMDGLQLAGLRHENLLTPRHDLQVQLAQLLFAYRSGRIDHQVDRLRRLRKRDHLAKARRTGQDHHNPVEAERNPAVRWCSVFESVKKEPKPLLRLGVRHAQRAEDLGLHILPVYTDRT